MSQMIDPQQIISTHPITGRVHVETLNLEPSLTQQHFEAECDINNIVKKYDRTGELSHLNRRRGVYADFSDIPDYAESLDRINRAQEAFLTLDAKIRQRFSNDPQKLINFLSDERNREEALSLGLIDRNDPIPASQPGAGSAASSQSSTSQPSSVGSESKN